MILLVLSAFFSETGILIRKFCAKNISGMTRRGLYRADVDGSVVLFGITGQGRENVGMFFRDVLDRYEGGMPGLVISTGYAGALKEGLAAGDAVIADQVSDLVTGKTFNVVTGPVKNLPAAVGPGLTVGRLAGMDAKREISAGNPGALFVDMESSSVLEHCARRNIPCTVVRCISDPAGFVFPTKEFVRDSWRDIPVRSWFARAVTDPADFFRAVRLQRNLLKSRRKIAAVVSGILANALNGSFQTGGK